MISMEYLASILGVSPLSLSPVCSSSVRTEAARNSAWRLDGTRARNGLTALTAATSWLWLVKVKEDSCTCSAVHYSTVQYSTVQYSTDSCTSQLTALSPAPANSRLNSEAGSVVSWYTGMYFSTS